MKTKALLLMRKMTYGATVLRHASFVLTCERAVRMHSPLPVFLWRVTNGKCFLLRKVILNQ